MAPMSLPMALSAKSRATLATTKYATTNPTTAPKVWNTA